MVFRIQPDVHGVEAEWNPTDVINSGLMRKSVYARSCSHLLLLTFRKMFFGDLKNPMILSTTKLPWPPPPNSRSICNNSSNKNYCTCAYSPKQKMQGHAGKRKQIKHGQIRNNWGTHIRSMFLVMQKTHNIQNKKRKANSIKIAPGMFYFCPKKPTTKRIRNNRLPM